VFFGQGARFVRANTNAKLPVTSKEDLERGKSFPNLRRQYLREFPTFATKCNFEPGHIYMEPVNGRFHILSEHFLHL